MFIDWVLNVGGKGLVVLLLWALKMAAIFFFMYSISMQVEKVGNFFLKRIYPSRNLLYILTFFIIAALYYGLYYSYPYLQSFKVDITNNAIGGQDYVKAFAVGILVFIWFPAPIFIYIGINEACKNTFIPYESTNLKGDAVDEIIDSLADSTLNHNDDGGRNISAIEHRSPEGNSNDHLSDHNDSFFN